MWILRSRVQGATKNFYEPLAADFVTTIIESERPDGLLVLGASAGASEVAQHPEAIELCQVSCAAWPSPLALRTRFDSR